MTIVNSAQEKGAEALREAEKVTSRVNDQIARLAESATNDVIGATQSQAVDLLASLRAAVEAGANSLRRDGHMTLGNLVEGLTDNVGAVERTADGFETHHIAQRVRTFIQEKPLLAFGGLAAIGFVAAAAMQAAGSEEQEKAGTKNRKRKK